MPFDLPRSRRTLKNLLAYLSGRGIGQEAWIEHDVKCERHNLDDPRSFCFVRQGSTLIHCASALEYVEEPVRMGILLHEIGHLAADAFGADECEVDVDAWVLTHVPESGYKYVDHEYTVPGLGTRTAVNVETVSDLFARGVNGLGN